MAKWDELADGAVIRRTVGTREVAIFRRGDDLYAIDAQCPHRRGPLDEACLEDGFIAVCPWHGWRFDIRTGKSPTNPARVLTYKTSVRDGMIYVDLP